VVLAAREEASLSWAVAEGCAFAAKKGKRLAKRLVWSKHTY